MRMKEQEEKLYSIGKVSELLQIPASALRFYDDEEILTPAVRNDDTGYRYYAEKQIMKCMMISEMRRLDIPVSDIRTIIKERKLTVQREILTKRKELLKSEMEYLRFKYNYIEEVLGGIDLGIDYLTENRVYKGGNIPIKIRYMPAFYAVRIPVFGCFYEQEKFCRTQKNLYDVCEKYHLKICGQPISHFKDPMKIHFEKDFYESEWLLPVQKPENTIQEGIEVPEKWLISAVHIGSYQNISTQYDRVLEFVTEQELKIVGGPMEEYIINCANICGSENFVTNVMFPIDIKV